MPKVGEMQARDERMFNGLIVREHVYRGPDKSYLSKAEITAIQPVDNGSRPMLGKFSTFNLSYLLPEQRRLYLEQMKFEQGLKGAALNQYLSVRYSEEDMYNIWLMEQKASQRRKHKVGTPKHNTGLKRRIVFKQRHKLTPEQNALKTAKTRATRERNKLDPSYISYEKLQQQFRLRQKLLTARSETRTRQAIAVFANGTIKRKVYSKTMKLERENKQLKEFIKQNHLHLPGSKKEKMRRNELRAL